MTTCASAPTNPADILQLDQICQRCQSITDHVALLAGKRLSQRLRGIPHAVILFGSRQRSNSRPDSDVDLMVVIAEDNMEAYRIAVEAMDQSRQEQEAFGLPALDVSLVDHWERRAECHHSDGPPTATVWCNSSALLERLPLRVATGNGGPIAAEPTHFLADRAAVIRDTEMAWIDGLTLDVSKYRKPG